MKWSTDEMSPDFIVVFLSLQIYRFCELEEIFKPKSFTKCLLRKNGDCKMPRAIQRFVSRLKSL